MAEGGAGYRLGVDLGTTFTAAAIERDGQVRMVSLGLRQPEIPSVLAIRDGETLVGDTAERLAVARPEIMAREFKRRIGDSTAMIVDGTPWTAEALTGRLLAFVLDEVKRVEGEPPTEVIVTHPANWGEFKLDRLRQAMLLAGCEDGTLMPEPVAAARYYASQGRVSDGQRLAVFDFGGGTFDAAIIQSVDGELRVIGQPKGLERLGGIDLDQAVLTHVLHHAEIDLNDLDDTPANRQAVGRLRQDCRDAKETLSSDTTAIVPVMLPGVHSEVRITRAEFEKMIREPLLDAIKVVRAVIESAQLDPADIDALLLVGGSSRIPYVSQVIGEELARPVLTDAHPKHTIAQGAASSHDRLMQLGSFEKSDKESSLITGPPADGIPHGADAGRPPAHGTEVEGPGSAGEPTDHEPEVTLEQIDDGSVPRQTVANDVIQTQRPELTPTDSAMERMAVRARPPFQPDTAATDGTIASPIEEPDDAPRDQDAERKIAAAALPSATGDGDEGGTRLDISEPDDDSGTWTRSRLVASGLAALCLLVGGAWGLSRLVRTDSGSKGVEATTVGANDSEGVGVAPATQDPVEATVSDGADGASEVANVPQLGGRVTISGYERSEIQVGAIQRALSEFGEARGITITYAGLADWETELTAAVDAGTEPDISFVPNSNALRSFYEAGAILPLSAENQRSVEADWSRAWLDLGAVDGVQVGVPTGSSVKSLVWFKPSRFEQLGYSVPETWPELKVLTERAIADGNTPWCVGIESGTATGWPFADWVEELVLGLEGPEVYDQWVAHDIPFSDERILSKFAQVGELWSLDSAVFASGGSIAETNFGDPATDLASDKCLMHRQAAFLVAFFPAGTAFADGSLEAIGVFRFPTSDGSDRILGDASIAVALHDRPEVWAVLEFLGSSEYATARKAAQVELAAGDPYNGQYLSAVNGATSMMLTPLEAQMVGILRSAEIVREDASDLMPVEVGASEFWLQGTSYVNGNVTAEEAVAAIDQAWP